jgi:hypothetical protein
MAVFTQVSNGYGPHGRFGQAQCRGSGSGRRSRGLVAEEEYLGHGDTWILVLVRKEVSGRGREWYVTSYTAGIIAAVLRAPRTLRRRRR